MSRFGQLVATVRTWLQATRKVDLNALEPAYEFAKGEFAGRRRLIDR